MEDGQRIFEGQRAVRVRDGKSGAKRVEAEKFLLKI